MRNYLPCLACFCALQAEAQQSLGVRGGVSLSNILSEKYFEDSKPRTGLMAGLTYQYDFKENFYAGADLLYAERGWVTQLVYTDDMGVELAKGQGNEYTHTYISLPIKAGVSVGEAFHVFFDAGVVPSYLVKARVLSPSFQSDSYYIPASDTDVIDQVTTFDLTGLFEFGLGYSFINRCRVYSTFGFQGSFTELSNKDFFEDSHLKYVGVNAALGLSFRIAD